MTDRCYGVCRLEGDVKRADKGALTFQERGKSKVEVLTDMHLGAAVGSPLWCLRAEDDAS